jgi:hypothetical protein
MCQLIEQQLTLERHVGSSCHLLRISAQNFSHFWKIQRLEGEADDIRWQFVSREATVTFSDSAAQRLLEIQGQIGQVSR